ncbi:aryl hydrocarbon receptor-like isoform X1 [Leopardus geoffroyi]|uniref:aryl hydrocarbon receptor-like isoform X1 n=1 Tax=Leopardus geoffroyi TaxID=46844 RepID=UPI001E25F13F|nr:aryl hydrocarbon receptor-like isoform X1 [Leopardus geoffroyi]
MLSIGGRYAGKKRKKPARRSPKPQPPEGAKSNPSKRHRDRLNQELTKLTNLLPFPEDVRARLDKLSILRLIVGYLKVKSYFAAILKDSIADCSGDPPMNPGRSEHTSPQVNAELFSEGDLLLQALNGFLMAVTEDGYVLYVSPTVQDYLGFHQSDVIYQSVFELIHKEDRAMFQSQFLWPPDAAPISREGEQDNHPLPGENCLSLSGTPTDSLQHQPLEDPSYLERSFVCRFRCLLDNSSGFLELNFHGHLKLLPGQNNTSEDGILMSPQLTLFAIATPRQPLTILELQNKTFIFQTKHKLDFTPIACDSRGKVVLGYTDSELCRKGSGYQFIHAADMMHCAENHVRMMRTGESGLTVFRLLTKQAGWLWVQSNARLVFRGGQPDCIVARQRALTNAEGEDHLRKRALQLPFTFTTGEAILYDSSPLSPLTSLPARKRIRARKGTPTGQGPVHPGSLLGAMMRQDESMYLSCMVPTTQGSPLERQGSNGRHEDEEEKEKEEDHSFLSLIETLLEKDTEEQPDLCSTLQHLGVTDLKQCLWEESLLRADSGPAGSQNFHPLPSSQGGGSHREKEVLFHDSGNVALPPPASTTVPQTLKPQPSLGSGQLTREVTPPQNMGTVPSCLHTHTQHFFTTGPTFQSPPQWQPQHTQAAPLNFGICHKPTIFDFSPLPEASSPRQPAQVFQPNHTSLLPLGENVVPGHLDQPDPGFLDFCKEPMLWTASHSGQCQGPFISSDPTSWGTHPSESIWDSPIQGQPVMVPVEVEARQAQPDPFHHLKSTMANSCPPWAGPASDIPPELCCGLPPSVQGALGTPKDTLGSQEHPPHSLVVSQLSGSPACPSQELLHRPLAMQDSYSMDCPCPAAKQQQWLQTQEAYGPVREGFPSVQHLGGCSRDAVPPALQPSPFLSSKSSSPGIGSSQCKSPAEPTRRSKDRPVILAPGAVVKSQVQSSPVLPPCHPDPACPSTSTQGSHDLQLQVGVGKQDHGNLGVAGRGAPSAELLADLNMRRHQPS